MNDKNFYTRFFLSQLNKSCDHITVIEHNRLWWKNTRANNVGSLRLTEEGAEMLNHIDLHVYEIMYPKDIVMTAQILIFLDRFVDCPYYLTDYSITVTKEKKAVELSLFNGDIRKYGLIKAMKIRENNIS